MVSIDSFRTLALAFPFTTELPHFEKTSFRVNSKIFATYSDFTKEATVKLSPEDQSLFCSVGSLSIKRIAGKWGLMGWTLLDLTKIQEELLNEILSTAFCEVASKKTVKIYLDSLKD